jgi:hypothetical protein
MKYVVALVIGATVAAEQPKHYVNTLTGTQSRATDEKTIGEKIWLLLK